MVLFSGTKNIDFQNLQFIDSPSEQKSTKINDFSPIEQHQTREISDWDQNTLAVENKEYYRLCVYIP